MSETENKDDTVKVVTPNAEGKDDHKDSGGIGIVDCLRTIVGLLLLSGLVSYLVTGDSFLWNYKPYWLRPKVLAARLKGPVILTDGELARYAGQNETLPIYLALNGTIYDVTAGRRIYGPGGPYNQFAGRDATRAYITGCFKDDSVADYRGAEWTFIPLDVEHFKDKPDQDLSEAQREYRYEMVEKGLQEVDKAIAHWAKLFRGETGKDYFQVGHVSRNKKLLDVMPLRSLCPPAEKKRPKAKFDEKKKYRRTERAEKVGRLHSPKTGGRSEL